MTLHYFDLKMKKQVLPSSIDDEIHHFEYKLLLNTPSLRTKSLIHHLCMPNFRKEQRRLYTQLDQKSKVIAFQVMSPDLYIQKIRAIYYLLLQQTYQYVSETFLRVFNLLRLDFYKKNSVNEVRKKYLAQFVQFIRYGEKKENIVKDTLNKYPIMDQILIDLLLSGIQADLEGVNSTINPDDNYNIVSFLQKFGLNCSAKTLWELSIQDFEIKVNKLSFVISKYEKENILQQNVSTGAVSVNDSEGKDQLQFSNVFSFSDKVFDNMDKSFIEMLNSFIKEDEILSKEKKSSKCNEKNEEKMFKNLKKTLNPVVYESTEFQKSPLMLIEKEKKPKELIIQNQSMKQKPANLPTRNFNKTEIKQQKFEPQKITGNKFFSPKNSPILKYRSTLRILSPGFATAETHSTNIQPKIISIDSKKFKK